jgi:hypothetical protein
MAIRVFKYTVGGAMLHSMTSTKAELNITFPQPCVIFLKSTKNTPKTLTWNVEFFDGQKVALQVPTIRLAELSIQEIAERDLLPIGQFYLRTFEKLTESKIEPFLEAAVSLLSEINRAAESGAMPYNLAIQMEDTIRKTFDNTVIKSHKEVGSIMTTNIVETLPWIDYSEVFIKIEERGKAEGLAKGEAKGKAEGLAEGEAKGEAKGRAEGLAEGEAKRDMEIALRLFAQQKQGLNQSECIKRMKDLGIPDETIKTAQKQYDAQQ